MSLKKRLVLGLHRLLVRVGLLKRHPIDKPRGDD